MHILFLTDNFPPEVNAPASRTFEHCREWVKAGAEVTVITTAPNFPTGKIFAGYRNKLWQTETMEGVRVIRVWSYITANAGFLKRTLDYVSFMCAATIASVFVPRVSVVVATSPQFFTAVGGFLVSVLKQRPWVFELRDLWPESIKAVGAMKDGLALCALVALEEFLYRRASAIVCVTQPFRRHLTSRGVAAEKVAVVTNGVELSQFSARDKPKALLERYGLNGRFVAGYVGTHGMAHGLEILIDAARLLAANPAAKDCKLLFLGDGAEKKNLVEKARELENVIFLESVPKNEVADHWALLDVSIIHLRKNELFKTVIPSKIFESMAMGLPIIIGVEGEAADIVQREGVGLPVEPENALAMAEAIAQMAGDEVLRRNLGARGIAAAQRYDRRRLARAMLSHLENVAAGRVLSAMGVYPSEEPGGA
jgi:glycosyltransferase involved in cell wall biosynthesis